MESDWTDWIFFLEMLSVERTKPFVRELSLPFEQDDFSNVMRLARACLEVYMFPTIKAVKENPDFSRLIHEWEKYRSSEAVLSDNDLQSLAKKYDNLNTATRSVFLEFQDIIGAHAADDLKTWYVTFFQCSPNPAWQWPWALRLLFVDDSIKIEPTNVVSITEKEQQQIQSFCTRYYAKKRDLEMRFLIIRQASTAALPTVWESVLQSFEGNEHKNNYPWLGTIEQCLQFRLILKEWDRLKKELKPNRMARVVRWVKEQEKLLPYDTVLPDKPAELHI